MLQILTLAFVLAYFGQQFFDESVLGQELGSEYPPPEGPFINEEPKTPDELEDAPYPNGEDNQTA